MNFLSADGLRIERIGYGAGTADLGAFPNCLRLLLGQTMPDAHPAGTVRVIEANIDDMSAQELAYAASALMAAGALDVVIVPVLMKKGRPGHQLQVLAAPDDADRIADALFAETTTIGVRMSTMDRQVLDREIVEVATPLGSIRVKVSRRAGEIRNVSPEYEDCAGVARRTGRPLHEVRETALRCYRDTTGKET